MLISEPTAEKIAEWKNVFEACHSTMKPNRKSGEEVDRYFRKSYPYQVYDSPEFREIVRQNITENDYSRQKLPVGAQPLIKSYRVDSVLVGIDLTSGEFHVESENIPACVPIYDDLFLYRGLDEEDLNNFFLVAEYVQMQKRNEEN